MPNAAEVGNGIYLKPNGDLYTMLKVDLYQIDEEFGRFKGHDQESFLRLGDRYPPWRKHIGLSKNRVRADDLTGPLTKASFWKSAKDPKV